MLGSATLDRQGARLDRVARRALGLIILVTLVTLASLAACTEEPQPQQPQSPQPAVLALPGNTYYPESITASTAGTLYVGSLVSGQVVAFDPGATAPRTVIAAGGDVASVTGVHVEGDSLWLCSIDLAFQRANELRSFALDGSPRGRYPLAAGQFCNDIAFDSQGNAYVTDSFSGTVLRLPRGGTALETWLSDAALAPASAGAFGLNGIAFDGGALYLGKFDTGGLYRVAIGADGRPGAIAAIAVAPALSGPDGIRRVAPGTLLVVEGNASKLSSVRITGATATATTVGGGLDMPTGVVTARGSAWVTEAQLGRFLAQPPQPPVLPFAVRRVALPAN